MNPCRVCGAAAVEQVRGALKKGDRGWVGPDTNQPDAETANVRPDSSSSNNPANAKDCRVACTQCDNQQGWGAGEQADYLRFCWNRDNPGPIVVG